MNATPALELRGLSKAYRQTTALDSVNTTLDAGRIYGLLGRNGAGKSTLMSLATAQSFPTAGEALVFGHTPYEHRATLERMCFVKESQKYPEDFTVRLALKSAAIAYPNWDQDFADGLVRELRLPLKRRVKKLSRGQFSAVGIVIGLASRADLTFFDEPYLGLDAVARQVFYDNLLNDFAEHPRTVVLSSHLIDEIADVLEHVLLLEDGHLVLDAPVDEVRGAVTSLSGPSQAVLDAASGLPVLARRDLGPVTQLTVRGRFNASARAGAEAAGIGVEAESLQQSIVFLTRAAEAGSTKDGAVGTAFTSSTDSRTGGTP